MALRHYDMDTSLPPRLRDNEKRRVYKPMRFFGKGGFAKCYELVDMDSTAVFAGKVVSKQLLVKNNYKEKMIQEIRIHRSLDHPNVVKFHSFFEDQLNVYIVLELCKNRSMLEMHKRRQTITEYECRYFLTQIARGVKYLHDNSIIHRDIKLSNLFLDDFLHVKIGDFGLATRIEFVGQRKMTMCGTPNYIAPEILTKQGHSFEVDIWSIGCVMFTLLVGHPPFQTRSLKETYAKIKRGEYCIPPRIHDQAADMIVSMLQIDPTLRPTINQLMYMKFLKAHSVPEFLPVSCLTMTPRLDSFHIMDVVANEGKRRALTELNTLCDGSRLNLTFLKNNLNDSIRTIAQIDQVNHQYRSDVESLCRQLAALLNSRPILLPENLSDEKTDPSVQPLFWVAKWVDYSDKYGFGYQLNDGCIGVMFNDANKLILLPNQIDIHFIDKDGKESYMTVNDFPKEYDKSIKLLLYFKRYMSEHLVDAGEGMNVHPDRISRMPHLYSWFRTPAAICMHLNNATMQFNFSDHLKLILCPRMGAVSYIDTKKNFRSYRFTTIAQHGCSPDLYQKIRYAYQKIKKLLDDNFF